MSHIEDLLLLRLLQNAVDDGREVLQSQLVVAAGGDSERSARHRANDVRQLTCHRYLNFQNSSWAGSRVMCFRDQVFPLLLPIHTS